MMLWIKHNRKVEFRLQIVLRNSPLKNIIFFEDEFIFSRSIEHNIIIIEKNVLGRRSGK